MANEDTKQPQKAAFKNAVGCLALVSLFFLECEYLLRMPEHHEVRKALRALIGLPVHDFLFATITFLVIAKLLASDRIPNFVPDFSSKSLIVHVASTVALDLSIIPLYHYFQQHPSLELAWWPILTAYFLTWLACLSKPQNWPKNLAKFGPWLAGAFDAGIFSFYFSNYVAHFWYAMPRATLWLTEKWLDLAFSNVQRGPGTFEIGTSTFGVDVGAPCSGYEGMGLIACYVAAFLWLRKDALRFPQAFILLPLAVGLSWTANTLRIALIIAIGTCYSPKIALDGFHTQAGWLTFTIIGIGLVLLVERGGWFRKTKIATEPPPSLPYLLPLMVIFLVQIASAAMISGFDFYYPVRVTLLALILFHFRKDYRQIFGPTGIEAIACGLAVFFLWMIFATEHSGTDPTQFLSGGKLTGWILFRIAGAVIIVPIVEELAFRGYLLRRLQALEFEKVPIGHLTLFSVLASSLLFGLLHQDWIAGTIAGILYALILLKRGSLTDAIVAHGVTNLCLAIHVLVTGAWGYW